MIRGVFYTALVAVFAFAIVWTIGVIKEKKAAPTISIANEFKEHGKPVEVFEVPRGELKFYERVTGDYRNGQVELFVSKIQWRKIKKGQEARIFKPAGEFVEGKVSHVAGGADTETGLYRVVVTVEEPIEALVGQNVVVDINTKTLRNVVSVPSASIERDGKESFVWILNDDLKATRRPVKKGEVSQMRTQILEGLEVGEKIIVRGASSLEKGDVARVVSDGEEK